MRSSRNDVFVLKYWGSLIAAVPAVTLWHDATVIGRLVIVLPFALAAFFLATLVELRIQNGGISYRRFVSWVRVEDGDILATDLAAVPIVGRMSLRRPVLPWGRVYFVLDAPRRRGLFERGEYQLVTALQGRPIPPRPVEPRSSTYRRLGSGLAIGVVAAIVLIAYARRDTVLPPDPTPPSPSGAASFFQWFSTRADVQVVFIALLAIMLVRKPESESSWVSAFMIGFLGLRILADLIGFL